ncbi:MULTISPECIES: hypothetical protein [Actinosynnema]|uniref:hypothetical protein n=1 Tax=Actinosynnema TaxID=40566 RepID=UPI0020A5AD21|nr:hypothetical protein [Actinosynnema pretiosum]MCP2097268.1 hypothetical protein [Actinosynnema pretiosum]
MSRQRDPGRTAVNGLGVLALLCLAAGLVLAGVCAAVEDPGALELWRNGLGTAGGLLGMMWGFAMRSLAEKGR